MANEDQERNVEDIETLVEILEVKERADLAALLHDSSSRIDMSDQYGSYWFSLKSTFDIYSPPKNNELLRKLNKDDQQVILDAVLSIHPPQENSAEIVDLRFIAEPANKLKGESRINYALNLLESEFPDTSQLIYCYEDLGPQTNQGRYPNILIRFHNYEKTARASPAVALNILSKDKQVILKSYCFDNPYALLQLAREALKGLHWLKKQT